ncbi:MAG: transcriptional regulator [Caulobacter sp.]|nr:transcriptional regulator [Caulobacter sp.]
MPLMAPLDSRSNPLNNDHVIEAFGYPVNPSARLDATFAALADPTRRAILARLSLGEASVRELAQPFAMSQPAISRHLKVLEKAGLIAHGVDAQRRPRRIQGQPMAEATRFLWDFRQFWAENFDRLDDLLAVLQAGEDPDQT